MHHQKENRMNAPCIAKSKRIITALLVNVLVDQHSGNEAPHSILQGPVNFPWMSLTWWRHLDIGDELKGDINHMSVRDLKGFSFVELPISLKHNFMVTKGRKSSNDSPFYFFHIPSKQSSGAYHIWYNDVLRLVQMHVAHRFSWWSIACLFSFSHKHLCIIPSTIRK